MYSDEDDIYVEPDSGETALLDIDDKDDHAYHVYKAGTTTFIHDMLVEVVGYTQLEPLGFCQGHRARISILRV